MSISDYRLGEFVDSHEIKAGWHCTVEKCVNRRDNVKNPNRTCYITRKVCPICVKNGRKIKGLRPDIYHLMAQKSSSEVGV